MTTALETEKKFTQAMFLLGGIISLVFGILLISRTEGTIEVIMLLLGLWWPQASKGCCFFIEMI